MGGGCHYLCKLSKLDKELISASSSEGDLVSSDVLGCTFKYK